MKTTKKIRLELSKTWANYHAGDKIMFGGSKGKRLVDDGTAVEIPAYDESGTLLQNEIKPISKELIRLKLLKNWAGYRVGSVMDFGESKGRPLILNNTAIEVSKSKKINKIADLGNSLFRVKLIKSWGGYRIGSVIDIGERKAQNLIDNGFFVKVSKKEKILKIA